MPELENEKIEKMLTEIWKKLQQIEDNQEQLEFRQTKMEERVAGLQKSVNQGLGLSGESKLKVLDKNGRPTPDAFQVLYDTIEAGVEGLGNQYFQDKWDYTTRQSANNKKNAVAGAFPDLLKVHGNKKAVGSENKLIHRDIKKAGATKEQLLLEAQQLEKRTRMSEKDRELIECPECSTDQSRTVWKNKLDWKCPNCEADLEPQ